LREQAKAVKKTIFYKFGIGFLIASVLFLVLPAVTLLISMPIQLKAKILIGCLVLAEVTFWIGVLLAGKGIVNQCKYYIKLKKWRKKEVQDHDKCS